MSISQSGRSFVLAIWRRCRRAALALNRMLMQGQDANAAREWDLESSVFSPRQYLELRVGDFDDKGSAPR
jgi:hypothetical protein